MAHQEHQLWEAESRGEASETDRERLTELQVTLDQCWTSSTTRRARRGAGMDPDDAQVRDAREVEGYLG